MWLLAFRQRHHRLSLAVACPEPQTLWSNASSCSFQSFQATSILHHTVFLTCTYLDVVVFVGSLDVVILDVDESLFFGKTAGLPKLSTFTHQTAIHYGSSTSPGESNDPKFAACWTSSGSVIIDLNYC